MGPEIRLNKTLRIAQFALAHEPADPGLQERNQMDFHPAVTFEEATTRLDNLSTRLARIWGGAPNGFPSQDAYWQAFLRAGNAAPQIAAAIKYSNGDPSASVERELDRARITWRDLTDHSVVDAEQSVRAPNRADHFRWALSDLDSVDFPPASCGVVTSQPNALRAEPASPAMGSRHYAGRSLQE